MKCREYFNSTVCQLYKIIIILEPSSIVIMRSVLKYKNATLKQPRKVRVLNKNCLFFLLLLILLFCFSIYRGSVDIKNRLKVYLCFSLQTRTVAEPNRILVMITLLSIYQIQWIDFSMERINKS